ncbi:MAG: LysR family transcriptional regulator [Xanthobacteraceae bacterium]
MDVDLDLRRIRSFLALAEHGRFGSAAEAVGVSQPTLSAHIAQLEIELGVPLVSRTTRRVRLTPLGEKFLQRARRAIEDLEHVTVEIRDEAALQRGRVIVACNRMLAAHALSTAVHIFQQKFPGVIVQIVDDLSPMVERTIVNGEADFGLAPRPESASLTFHHLIREAFIFAAARSSGGDGGGGSLLDRMGKELITMPVGSNIRRIIDVAFSTIGVKIRPKFEVRDHNTAIGMVRAGLGVTLLPQSAFSKSAFRALSMSRIRQPQVFRDLGLIHQRGYQLTPVARELSTILRRVMQRQKAK